MKLTLLAENVEADSQAAGMMNENKRSTQFL
jgi:hypothetical protein